MALYSSFVDIKRGICVTPSGSRELAVSGLADISAIGEEAENPGRLQGRAEALLKAAKNYFDPMLTVPTSAIAEEGVSMCSTHLSCTPDDLPMVGRLAGSLYLNVGHGHRPLALSCGTARITADIICNNSKSDISLCSVSNKSDENDGGLHPLCSANCLSPLRFRTGGEAAVSWPAEAPSSPVSEKRNA